MKMQFIGKDSLGYINGKIYEVEINSQDDIIILHSKGHPNCPYQSLKVLLKNWKEIDLQPIYVGGIIVYR